MSFLKDFVSALSEPFAKAKLSAEKTLEERNEEYLAFREKEIEKIRAFYDLDTIEGIESIQVPCFEPNADPKTGKCDSPTGRVEYYLHKKCFADHWNSGKTDLALACLRKAQELMYISDMMWKRSDFMRLVTHLHEAGNHEEANKEHKRLDMFFSAKEERLDQKISFDVSASLSFLETDLVEVDDSGVCCELCAKYRNRIYSISGKDKRFPKFPEDFHLDCGLKPYPFVWGVSEPTFSCKNIIKYSNRPFKDDRSKEDVNRHNNWKAQIKLQQAGKKKREENRKEFFWLQEHLPELCPKSLSGYSRMKNAKSEVYLNIVKEAKKLGKII